MRSRKAKIQTKMAKASMSAITKMPTETMAAPRTMATGLGKMISITRTRPDGAEGACAARAAAELQCGGGWVSPRYGACGAESASLEVHLMMGGVRGEMPCTGAYATCEALLRRRNELYKLEELSWRVNEIEPFSLKALLRRPSSFLRATSTTRP
jgi:hypothetical protein